jgi:outer membrane protein assembly factor BamB
LLVGLGWVGLRFEGEARAKLDEAIGISRSHLELQSFVEARSVINGFLESGYRFSPFQKTRAREYIDEIDRRMRAWDREEASRQERKLAEAGVRVKELKDLLARERERNPSRALDFANHLYSAAEQARMPDVQREAEEASRALTAHLTEAFDLKKRADDLEAAGKLREAALQVDQLLLKYANTDVARAAYYPIGLRVRPLGVRVTLLRNGTLLGLTGEAPLKYRIRSGESVRFRFEKRGYVVEERDVTDKTAGEMAVDLTQKLELWRVPLGVQIMGTPAVEGGTLYVAGANRLYALADSERPELLWSEVLDGEISGPPRAAGGRVTVGTSAGWLYAVDAKSPRDRRVAWRLALGSALRGSPAVSADGATIYGVTADRVLHAVDAARGMELWNTRLPAGTRVEPVVAAGLVVVACDEGTLLALRGPRKEDEAWRIPIPGGIEAAGSHGSTLYVVSGDRNLRALEVTRGDPIWVSPMEAGAAGRPERNGGTVYVPGRDGRLRYIDAQTGARSAVFVSKGALEGGVTFAPSLVMFGSDDEFFYACDAATARMSWKLKSKGRVRPGAVVGSGRVYFCCEDSVYSVELN